MWLRWLSPANETVVVLATPGARSGWFSLPVLRWGVVAAGLLAVTSVGVQQYRLHHLAQIVASNVVPSNAQSKNATGAVMQSIQPLPQAPAPKLDSKPLIFAPRVREGAKEAHPAESTVATASSRPLPRHNRRMQRQLRYRPPRKTRFKFSLHRIRENDH